MTEKIRLDLACGNNKREGFIGIDQSLEKTQADVAHDLESYPWPFSEGYADEVFCSHFIEHVVDLIAFMNEVWRVMKPGGAGTVGGQYYMAVCGVADPVD